MKSQTIFIFKLLIVSAVLSVAIKFAPVAISPTATNALIAVLLPTIIMAIALLWRYLTFSPQKIS
jgi:hypothetical protein